MWKNGLERARAAHPEHGYHVHIEHCVQVPVVEDPDPEERVHSESLSGDLLGPWLAALDAKGVRSVMPLTPERTLWKVLHLQGEWSPITKMVTKHLRRQAQLLNAQLADVAVYYTEHYPDSGLVTRGLLFRWPK